MKHRTTDERFVPCPICGRKPYVNYYPPNVGWVMCRGTFFRPHDAIMAEVQYEQPSKLTQTLASKWNVAQYFEFPKKKGAEE